MKNVLEHGSKWTREPGVLFKCQMCDCFFEASESSYTSIAQTCYGNGLILHKVTSICPECGGSAYSWDLRYIPGDSKNEDVLDERKA